ncbi:unnamed protein product [Thelazia callipaeda]|uniref:Tubulin-specific chaperone A n=1 Tax=Thelazia callipaeda TaxID=103827 RepID=A0A0N5CQ38_THECL|nr:unnamed protein product [Thelazia callipaeda]
MADVAVIKDINIKTNVVKRLINELNFYKKEVASEMDKLQALKGKGDADEYLMKKQMELVQVQIIAHSEFILNLKNFRLYTIDIDSEQMVPECKGRLEKAIEDLKNVVDKHDSVLQDTPEYTTASEQIDAGTKLCLEVVGTVPMN